MKTSLLGRIGAVIPVVVFLALVATPLAADENLMVIPVVHYESLVADGQTVHTPGGGVILLKDDNLLIGRYARTVYTEAPSAYRNEGYHAAEILFDGGVSRHRYLAVAKTASDKPVVGGWSTFQAAGVYGYEVFSRPGTSIVLGGGFALSDFGIETPAGKTWPLIPVPFIRISHAAPWYEFSFDFITGPNVNFTVAPEQDLSLVCDLRVDQFRDERDLIYTVALRYHVFSIGWKNETFGFDLAGEEEPLETFYYAAFAEIDLGILSVSGGYAYDTLLRYDEGSSTTTDRTGDGFVVSVQGMIPLGGGSR